jgi:hypothetical protein
MTFNNGQLYILDGFALNLLWRIADRLGSGEKVSDDQRRDMMNSMVTRLSDAIPYEANDGESLS